ncbi:MAG: glycosyltransferase [Nitrospirota bacterium]
MRVLERPEGGILGWERSLLKTSNRISVVIPCFNEESKVYNNILKIHEYLSENFASFEIIAVNDGSVDGTITELRRLQQEIPLAVIDNAVNEGKGKAVRDGFLMSRYETVMFMDADLAIPIESLDTFIPSLDNGYDIVIASRFVPGLRVLTPILWYRKIMEKTFRLLRMMILDNFAVQDTQCGFKVFSRRAAMGIFPYLTVKRFAFDSEIIFLATMKGYKIKELPISLQNPSRSSIRIFSDSANMLADLIRIRINSILMRY